MPDDKLRGIVERMVAAGESEADIAAVIQHYGTTQAAPAAPEKSVGGFLENAVSSTGKLVKDTAVGLKDVLSFIGRNSPMNADLSQRTDPAKALATIRAMPGALKDMVSSRYGSLDAVKDTLYNDPAGALADLSTLTGLGATATAARAPRLAATLRKVESATNPLRVMEPAAKAVEYGTAAAIRPMTKPPKGLRRQQSGVLEIERTALKEGAFTEGRAAAKQKRAAAAATAEAQKATSAVPRERITRLPRSLEKVEKGLDHGGDLDTLARVEAEAVESLPATVSASELLDKRRYLDRQLNSAFRAAERGGTPTGIRQSGQQEMVGNIRAALRDVAPDIRQMDDQTRRLGLVRSTLEDAGLRAGDVPMGAALFGGGLMAGGIPGAGAAGAAFGLGRTFPQIPLAAGSIPVRGTAAAAAATANPALRQQMLLSALLERLQQER